MFGRLSSWICHYRNDTPARKLIWKILQVIIIESFRIKLPLTVHIYFDCSVRHRPVGWTKAFDYHTKAILLSLIQQGRSQWENVLHMKRLVSLAVTLHNHGNRTHNLIIPVSVAEKYFVVGIYGTKCQVKYVHFKAVILIHILLTLDDIQRYAFRVESQMTLRDPGGRLNKKDGLTRYGDSHVKDKTS